MPDRDAIGLKSRQSATFWVYSAADGYSDLAFREKLHGSVRVSVNGEPVTVDPSGVDSPTWLAVTARAYLNAGINKIVVTGDDGSVALDKLTVTAVPGAAQSVYQGDAGTLTGTAHVDNSYSPGARLRRTSPSTATRPPFQLREHVQLEPVLGRDDPGGVIYSGSNGVGAALRASTAPNIDEIALAPQQVAGPN